VREPLSGFYGVCVRVQGVLLYKKHAHPSTLVRGVRKHTQAHPPKSPIPS